MASTVENLKRELASLKADSIQYMQLDQLYNYLERCNAFLKNCGSLIVCLKADRDISKIKVVLSSAIALHNSYMTAARKAQLIEYYTNHHRN